MDKLELIELLLLIIIIIGIILLQIHFFRKNYRRANEFRNIFSNRDSWRLDTVNYSEQDEDETTEDTAANVDVTGISGDGNGIFKDIISSINKYLDKKSGVEIDFGLVRETVDRHCDSVEDEIGAQTPIPLYCGLGGTMIGVILGLACSIPAVKSLLGDGTNASGITDLLVGVAMAMIASFFGLLLTTINILHFKKCKLVEENEKSAFLEWMQSEVRSEFPSGTSAALNNLVNNLKKFNTTFSRNTTAFQNVLSQVNQSSGVISETYSNAQKMAKENARIFKDLQECADKLVQFNAYLDSINGYTDAIHRFETLFNAEADKTNVLVEIRDYFARHKSEIGQSMQDADKQIADALASIKASTAANIVDMRAQIARLYAEFSRVLQQDQTAFVTSANGFRTVFAQQGEDFKNALKTELETFAKITEELKTEYSTQLKEQMPKLVSQLETVSTLPEKFDTVIDKLNEANKTLAESIRKSNESLVDSLATAISQSNDKLSETISKSTKKGSKGNGDPASTSGNALPKWAKIAICAIVVLFIICCCVSQIINVALMKKYTAQPPQDEQILTIVGTMQQDLNSVKEMIVSERDSTAVYNADHQQ